MAFEVTADPAAYSYADVELAADRHATHVGGAAFDALDEGVQEQLLNSASADIDTVDFIGERASTTQELEWPRTGTDYSPNAWPQLLVDATIELAWYNARTLASDADADIGNPSTANIKRDKTGPLETEWFAPGPGNDQLARFPENVRALLRRLAYVVPANSWGSATVSRAS